MFSSFQIFTNFACLETRYLNLNAHVMVDLLTRCLDMSASGSKSRKLQLALQTSAVQNLKTFAKYCETSTTCDANQAVPVLQFLCDKLQDGLVTSQNFATEFSLECILALLSNLPDCVAPSSRYHSFVWRTLCPTLLDFIAVPTPNANQLDHKSTEFRAITRYVN